MTKGAAGLFYPPSLLKESTESLISCRAAPCWDGAAKPGTGQGIVLSGAGQHGAAPPMGGGGPGCAFRPCPLLYKYRELSAPHRAVCSRAVVLVLGPAGAPDRCVPARTQPGSPPRPRGGAEGHRGSSRAGLYRPAAGGRAAARLHGRVQRCAFHPG